MATCTLCFYGDCSSPFAVCTPRITPHSSPPHTSGISSDYNSFLEAVKAAKAHEDERALELLAKSEEAIEEVVSTFEKFLLTGCPEYLLGLSLGTSGKSLGDDVRGCLWCGLILPPVNLSLTVETRSRRGQYWETRFCVVS